MSLAGLSRLLGLAAVGSFLVVAFTPLPNLLDRVSTAPSPLEPAEAIVVLAHAIDADGSLSSESLSRAIHGVVLHRRGFAPILVFSGIVRPGGASEAEARANLARHLGIPPEAILTTAGTHTTREEALRMAALLRPRGVSRILLVTESHHLRRARALFERAGFEVLAAPDRSSTAVSTPGARLGLMRAILQEFTARLYYRLAGYL